MNSRYLAVLLALLLLPSALMAQTREISLNVKNQSVGQVLKEIEQKSGFTFIYKDNAVDTKRKVSVSATNEDVLDVLKKIFSGTATEAEIVNHNINLFRSADARENTGQVRRVKVSGIVRDKTGPIIGAVVFYGQDNAVTDAEGAFSLTVPSNAVLEISCLGYAPQHVPLNGRTRFEFLMEEDAEVLQEAVALGYGAQTKKKDLSASVGIVNNAEQIAARPITSTSGMLQGQIPGVTVTASDGAPTSSPQIVIRGQGSKGGDSVLWVVDGVPGAPVASMSEVESIVVLKDAASAAIYGATSGAGGVILVTTKKAGKGVYATYDMVAGARSFSNLPQGLEAKDMLSVFRTAYENAGMTVNPGYYEENNPWAAVTRTDWFKEVFRTALYQRHNLALNVGYEKFKSRLTVEYQNNQGVVISSWNKQLNIRFNGEYQLNKWVRLTADAYYGQNDNHGGNGAIFYCIAMPRSSEVYQSAGPLKGWYGGTYTQDPAYFEQYENYGGLFEGQNPVRLAKADNTWSGNADIWATGGLEVGNIVKGLNFTTRFTYHVPYSINKSFSAKAPEVGAGNYSNTLIWSTNRAHSWRSESTLNFDRSFGKHTVGALGSVSFDRYSSQTFSIIGRGFDDESENMQFLNYAENTIGSDGYVGDDANISFVGRASYSYDDRYFVTASFRRDYAGRLPKGHEYGDFPAVTAAWKITNEPFFPKSDILNMFKIRASWGRIGNLGSVPMNYKSQTMGVAGWWLQPEAAIYGTSLDTEWGQWTYPLTAVNQTLTWETSEQWDGGVDIDLFKDRLSLSVDYYNKRTFNLLQTPTTGWPSTIGWNASVQNIGEIRNSGVELSLSWKDKIGKEFSYYVNGNYSYNRNRVLSTGILDEDGNEAPWPMGGAWGSVPWVFQTEAGQPMGSIYVVHCTGIFQNEAEVYEHNTDGKVIQPYAQPGDLRFEDYNRNGQIDTGDRQYVGTVNPPHTFALTLGADWKGFNFSMMWQGVAGNKVVYMAKSKILTPSDGYSNMSTDILNAWSPTHTDTNIPRISKNDPNGNFITASDWLVEDGSYVRLKNVTVGYDFTKLIRKIPHFAERSSYCQLYFSGENLLTFTKYSGMDPECGGYDTMNYPISRVLALGLKITY